MATFVAAGVTLAAYKFFNIRVTAKFTKIVFISTAAFAGLMLINFIFSLVTGSGGLRSGITGPVSGLSILVSAVAIVLAVLNLVLDFDYVERGVEMGAPAKRVLAGGLRPDRHDGLALHRDAPADLLHPPVVLAHHVRGPRLPPGGRGPLRSGAVGAPPPPVHVLPNGAPSGCRHTLLPRAHRSVAAGTPCRVCRRTGGVPVRGRCAGEPAGPDRGLGRMGA